MKLFKNGNRIHAADSIAGRGCKHIFVLILFLLILFAPRYAADDTMLNVSKTNFSGVLGSGARAFGMGGAFIAVADDATAASWNPGGLGQLEEPECSFVLRGQYYRSMIPANQWEAAVGDSYGEIFEGASNIYGKSLGFDFASITYPIRIGKFKIVPQISYQRAVSVDLSNKIKGVLYKEKFTDYEGDDSYVLHATTSMENKYSGGFDMLSISLGTTLFKIFHVGVTTNFWMNGFSGYEWKSTAGEFYNELNGGDASKWVTDQISFDMEGHNFNAGILVNVTDEFRIGAVYKSAFKASVDYDVSHNSEELLNDEVLVNAATFAASGASTLEWPESWGVGLSYNPVSQLTLSADYTQTNWSAAILKSFPVGETRADVYFPTLETVSEDAVGQLNPRQLRFGAEYIFIGKKCLIPLRLGFFKNTQYFPNAVGDKVTFHGFTGGLGYKQGAFAFDFAIQYETGKYQRNYFDFSATQYDEVRFYFSTTVYLKEFF
ncbi:MAG: hypothetical protein GY765_08925 [bacterium]|nr:hypothetical protein [bacterium]